MIPRTPENYRLLARHTLDQKLDFFFPCYRSFNDDEMKHIADIAASVMMTRDGVLKGGGFVQAVVENDLRGAIERADSTITHSIRFMVYVAHNVYLEGSLIFSRIETK